MSTKTINAERINAETTSVKTGLWIDHRHAILVSVTGHGAETHVVEAKVESGVETQPRRASDSPLKGPYEAQEVPADDSRQRALTGHLNIYYDAVIVHLRNAESIVIFGPGEAKGELRKRLEHDNLSARIVAVETADKMTDRQFVAKVRAYFSH